MARAKRDDSNDPNHSAEIYIIFAIFTVLSLTALILRLMSRRIKRLPYYYDDMLVIAAWIVSLGEGTMIATGFFALGILQTTALASAKLSVLVQLHRIFITRKFRLVTLILGAIVIGWYIAICFAYIFICIPIRSNWDPSIPHHCGNENVLNLFAPIPWILTDFAILIAPIPMVASLQLSRANKIEIIALFLTGGFTCIVACVRYSKLFYINNDITWSSTDATVWSVIETNVAVVCACIVAIKPALKYLFPESLISSAKARWLKFKSRRSVVPQSGPNSDPYKDTNILAEHRLKLPLYNRLNNGWGAPSFGDTRSVPLERVKIRQPSNSSAEPLWA